MVAVVNSYNYHYCGQPIPKKIPQIVVAIEENSNERIPLNCAGTTPRFHREFLQQSHPASPIQY
jgi:hypothetical protein